ncbi:hypothetical protein Chor_004706 [Crotalus horridus]
MLAFQNVGRHPAPELAQGLKAEDPKPLETEGPFIKHLYVVSGLQELPETPPVMDDASPGTQEYIMLRQDSIQSTELKKRQSPFRTKCHEIFCCPLKQVHLKENTELEDEECLLLERKQKEFDIDLPKWCTINDGEHMNINQAYTICP